MGIKIQAADPMAQPAFFGEVSGIDLRQPLTQADVAAIEAGHGSLRRAACSATSRSTTSSNSRSRRHFGPIEQATGDIAQGAERRLRMEINDISNLDKDDQVLARDDRRRLFSLGNMLWHSDSSFKPTPAKYSLLSARVIPPSGGNTEFADMRAA